MNNFKRNKRNKRDYIDSFSNNYNSSTYLSGD